MKSEVNLKWVLSFHDVGHKDQIHVSRLNSKLLYTFKKWTKKKPKRYQPSKNNFLIFLNWPAQSYHLWNFFVSSVLHFSLPFPPTKPSHIPRPCSPPNSYPRFSIKYYCILYVFVFTFIFPNINCWVHIWLTCMFSGLTKCNAIDTCIWLYATTIKKAWVTGYLMGGLKAEVFFSGATR